MTLQFLIIWFIIEKVRGKTAVDNSSFRLRFDAPKNIFRFSDDLNIYKKSCSLPKNLGLKIWEIALILSKKNAMSLKRVLQVLSKIEPR